MCLELNFYVHVDILRTHQAVYRLIRDTHRLQIPYIHDNTCFCLFCSFFDCSYPKNYELVSR